jgi:hypothetical protein
MSELLLCSVRVNPSRRIRSKRRAYLNPVSDPHVRTAPSHRDAAGAVNFRDGVVGVSRRTATTP